MLNLFTAWTSMVKGQYILVTLVHKLGYLMEFFNHNILKYFLSESLWKAAIIADFSWVIYRTYTGKNGID